MEDMRIIYLASASSQLHYEDLTSCHLIILNFSREQ